MFLALTPGEIARLISRATRRIVLVAPGIDQAVAMAIIGTWHERMAQATIIVDPDPEVCRLGYGSINGLTLLMDAQFIVRKAAGLRIGILIVDDKAWAFSPTPLVVEDLPATSQPNAIALNVRQAEEIVAAICPEPQSEVGGSTAEQSGSDVGEKPIAPPVNPVIGREVLKQAEVTAAQIDLKERPPQKFDLARRVRVYQSYLQFVELELSGCHIDRRTVQLPTALLNLQGSEEMKRRFKGQFKLIENDSFKVPDQGGKKGSKVSLKQIQDEVHDIRKHYLVSLGDPYGVVMLRSNKEKLQESIKETQRKIAQFRAGCVEALTKEFQKTRKDLIKSFAPSIRRKPPEDLMRQIATDKPTKEVAEQYLEMVLSQVFPDPEVFLQEMKLAVVFKDVTYETLQTAEFRKRVKRQLPLVEWERIYQEDDAVKAGKADE